MAYMNGKGAAAKAKSRPQENGSDKDGGLQYLMVKKATLHDPVLQADWAKKNLIWVPHEKEGFVAGSIVQEDGERTTVEIVETGTRMEVSKDDCQKMNPPKFEKVEDMADLSCLNEASVLHNLKSRYYSDLIYTYSGLFCVVVNPYKRLPIYTEELIETFKGKKRHELPPHIFAIADAAYRSMLQEREDQSILCTGESGAGKTENTKKVIQYLAHVAGATRHNKLVTSPGKVNQDSLSVIGELEQQLLQANPILEAFGNSKTVKNDNSSRFGKFIRINFDNSGYISGANIEFYLLEKSRTCRQADDERSFHIFYQFLAGTSPDERSSFLLESVNNYKFLKNGHISLPNVDDRAEFHNTVRSMKIMGFHDDEITSVLRVVSAILLFGNIEFIQERNNDQAVLPDDRVAQKICHLLGIPVIDFTKAFLKPRIKVGREHVQKAQNKEQAEFAVEAISKASYERMFKWLVSRINKSLDRTRRQGTSFIGILDIAGFEIFGLNSFEQLCINYTNEKLQQLFNNTMFVNEQEEYQREGINWEFIDFGLDLQPTIDLIEKPMGILALLDEQCLFPKATDKSFVEKLLVNHEKHPKFVVPEVRSRSDFAVVHYAGRVDYVAEQWLTKNMDPLNENVVALMQNSTDPFVVNIWKDAEFAGMGATEIETTFGARAKKGMFRTVSQLHKEQLTRLMTTLRNTVPHFVRCIIPNHEKKPGKINSLLVLEQLRCNGVLEGIRICRQGFPSRVPFQEFRHRYETLTPNIIPKGYMDGKEAVKKMTKALEMDANLFRIGQSKIFLRAGVLAQLEEERDTKLAGLIIKFQAQCRAFLARRFYQRRVEQSNAIRVLQRNGLSWLKLRNWQWWRLYTKVKPLLQVTNQEAVLHAKGEELRTAKERLQKRETEVEELQKRVDQLNEERSVLTEQLQTETEERNETEELHERAKLRINELNELLGEMQQRLEEEENRLTTLSEEKKQLQMSVRDLEEQLEGEEQARQKMQIEKANVDQKLKIAEEKLAETADTLEKAMREKKVVEERSQQLAAALLDEEEKNKNSNKKLSKGDQIVQDLRDEIDKENRSRQALEEAKRRLENDMREQKDLLDQKLNKLEELNQAVIRRDEDLHKALAKGDEDAATIARLNKEISELKFRISELTDDLESEKEARLKAEKLRRELQDELEQVRTEVMQAADRTQLAVDLQKEKDNKLVMISNQVEEQKVHFENRMEDLRSKMQRQLEESREEVDQIKRQKAQVDRNFEQLKSQKEELARELLSMQSAKADSEKRRKQAENVASDLGNRFSDLENAKAALTEQYMKLQQEIDMMNKNKDEDEQETNVLRRKIASLELDLAEAQAGLQAETNSKLGIQTKMRELESDMVTLQDALEETQQTKDNTEKENRILRDQLVEAKKKADEGVIQQLEEMRKKAARDLENAQQELGTTQEALSRSERNRKKLAQEVDDLNLELNKIRTSCEILDKKQKRFDQQLAEERNRLVEITRDRDQYAQESRDRETRILSLQNELDTLRDQLEDAERHRRVLQGELDEVLSHKDEAGKSVHELERINRQSEQEKNELRAQIEELEDALQIAEDSRLRLDVLNNGMKAEHDRALAAKDQEVEEKRRQLIKQCRDLEAELEDEKRLRGVADKNKKKAEVQLIEVERQLEISNRLKDDYNKQLKKIQQMLKDGQQQVEETRTARDETLAQLRETEKKLRNSDAEVQRLRELTEELLQQKRKLESQRDELEALKTRPSSLSSDEKSRLESRIADLEEENEEIQIDLDSTQERFRKSQTQVETLTSELSTERNLCQRYESEKQGLERVVRELRAKVEELETTAQTRSRATIAALEAKINGLEETLSHETADAQNAQRAVRRLEKKIQEKANLADEMQRSVDHFKEEIEKLNNRNRQTRRTLDEREEECSQIRAKMRGMQRQIDDLSDANDALTRDNASLTRELSGLRNRRTNTYRSATNMLSFVGGSNDRLEMPEDGESVGTEGSSTHTS
uniref:Myosin heavy chain n=1 Tax=Panagrolaimus superbus TaxID=310955 RepID=A0A914YEA6_9BILA